MVSSEQIKDDEANLHVMFPNTICWSHLLMFVEITQMTMAAVRCQLIRTCASGKLSERTRPEVLFVCLCPD